MTSKRQPAKRAPAKRAPAKVAVVPDDDATEVLEPDAFDLNADGSIDWTIGGESYHLQPVTIGELFDLDQMRQKHNHDDIKRSVTAAQLPVRTIEERNAKLAALAAGNDAAKRHLHDWWARVFEVAGDGKPWPHGAAPAWVMNPKAAEMVLEQLQGPVPPGVPSL